MHGINDEAEDELLGGDPAAGGEEGAAGGGDESEESVDDTLRAAYANAMEEPVAIDETADAATLARNRDKPSGKFIPGKPAAGAKPAPGATPAAAAGATGQQAPANGQQAPTPPADVLPATWRREMAESWKALPQNVREEIHRRENDARNGISQYKRGADQFNAVHEELIAPYAADFKAVGADARTALRDIVGGWSKLVRGDKTTRVGIFRQMLQGFGISHSDLGAPRDGGDTGQGQGHSSELANALQRIDQLQEQLQGFQQQFDGERQQKEEAEFGQVQQTWAQFRSDPKNEFVDKLQNRMRAMLNAGLAKDYADAYEQAQWLEPEVRATLQQRAAVKEGNDEAARAAAARKAGNVNTQRRGLPAPASGTPSVEDTLRHTFRRITASNG